MRRFEIDDEIICINNFDCEQFLTIGEKYKIFKIYIGTVTGLEHIGIIRNINNSTIPLSVFSSRFLSEKDFNLKQRKEKLVQLNKIK